ncbi:MAG: T9SS type A sorting domain-containing protein [Taibaiella sp.]|nr:T9SS type A sorting domain-containing protein [Taibaiella sp.]
MKRICLLSMLFLPVAKIAGAQTWHFGFEDWNETLTYEPVSNEYAFPDHQLCYPYLSGNAEGVFHAGEVEDNEVIPEWSAILHGLLRTTDAHSGAYAAIVHMWYNGSAGILAYGSSGYVNALWGLPKVHFENKLYGISGFYKYMVDSFIPNDTYQKVAMLHIVAYSRNTAGGLELMAHDSLRFEASGTYREFHLPATGTSIMPDSFSIWFEAKGYGSGGTSCSLAHFIYLDDVQFHFEPLSVERNYSLRKKLDIYPNPANDILTFDYENSVQIRSIQLTDVWGRVVRIFSKREKALNVSGLPGGMYFLNIQAEEGSVIEKIIIN